MRQSKKLINLKLGGVNLVIDEFNFQTVRFLELNVLFKKEKNNFKHPKSRN